mmetsp:Transcript_1483/g.3623  ORF Transcript_1483/g.3623 Transcript_1483/m.3623 type:complete len:166 (+) Transcript_1483:171-668(+)
MADITVVATADPLPLVAPGTAVATIDLTANDAAMVKLFERLGSLKRAVSFFVLDQGIDILVAIPDLSLCKLCRKPKLKHPVALRMETQFQLCNFYLRFKAMTSCPVEIKEIGFIPLADLKAYKQEVDQAKDPAITDAPKMRATKLSDFFNDFCDYLHATYGPIYG